MTKVKDRNSMGVKRRFKMRYIKLLIFAFLALPSIVSGADVGTCTKVTTEYGGGSFNAARVVLLCTAHTDGTLSVTLSDSIMKSLEGLSYTLLARPGSVAPTTDSDLSITSTNGKVLIAATVKGLDLVDDTSTRWTFFEGPTDGSVDQSTPTAWSGDPWIVALTNNGVASATFYLEIDRLGLAN